MCARFTLSQQTGKIVGCLVGVELERPFEIKTEPRFNIAPTQNVLAVVSDPSPRFELLRWGLIPSWAKDPKIANSLINARAETLAEKPSFRVPLRRQRCLVLADGFFEWKTLPGQKHKQPVYIRLKSREPFAFAGLWDKWTAPDGQAVKTCSIITTEPNDLMRPIHNRMPVILAPPFLPTWIAPGELPPATVRSCLQPYDAGQMEAFPVSPMVNNPRVDRPECIQRFEQPSLL
jgi:putative SOS response-associated peptidase YedK